MGGDESGELQQALVKHKLLSQEICSFFSLFFKVEERKNVITFFLNVLSVSFVDDVRHH